jgi:hypothetical protein
MICAGPGMVSPPCGHNTEKEGFALFQGWSSIEQCNVYVPFQIAFRTRSKYLHCLFRLQITACMCPAGTGKIPREVWNRARFGEQSGTVRLKVRA